MTAVSTQIISKVSLLSEVLCSGSFAVPWHQRYYNWEVVHVEDLLTDIRNAHSHGKACYFLGSIMLVDVPKPKVAPKILNDGQQRLITLSMLIAALSRRFAQQHNPDRTRESRAIQALFGVHPRQGVQLRDASGYQPRIKPPQNDKFVYNQIIIGNDIGTSSLLASAWNIIDAFVKNMDDSACKNLFDFLMSKVEISVLRIPSSVDANLVFESLNARGKPLDSLDLIRNRLYSYFSDEANSHRREIIHSQIENIRVIVRGSKKTEDYYRCYFQCNYGHIKKAKFYRQVRDHIEDGIKACTKTRADGNNSADYVCQLVQSLGKHESIELFRTINSSEPNLDLQKHLPKTQRTKRNLAVLLKELRPYTVSHPLIFALLHRFVMEPDPKKNPAVEKVVVQSLANLASFVMRTTLIAPKFEPSKFEMEFANCAKTVFKGTRVNSLYIHSHLPSWDRYNVMDDDNFIRRLAERDFPDAPRVLRCLFGINEKQDPNSDAIKESACSVEHILPQSSSHWKGWTKFTDLDAQKYVNRIGNLTIVTKGQNKSSSKYNRSLEKKLESFRSSSFHMTRSVAESYPEWTPSIVVSRSSKLAKKAAEIWKFAH